MSSRDIREAVTSLLGYYQAAIFTDLTKMNVFNDGWNLGMML